MTGYVLRLFTIALIAVGVVAIVACGGSDGDEEEEPTAEATEPADEPDNKDESWGHDSAAVSLLVQRMPMCIDFRRDPADPTGITRAPEAVNSSSVNCDLAKATRPHDAVGSRRGS